MVGLGSQVLRTLRHKRWPASTTAAPLLDTTQLVEEERSPFYNPQSFYPARIGEVLNNRYQIAAKLGYGSRSTVWLARDLQAWRWFNERFVAIKIKSNRQTPSKQPPNDEMSILNHISEANPRHEGWSFVRQLTDCFNIECGTGKHQCPVFEPLRETLFLYCRRWPGDAIPSFLLKIILQMVLQALDYLHSECHIIHTDLKPDNIMIRSEDDSILPKDALSEYLQPLPQKHCPDGRIIYLSRNNYGPLITPTGTIRICDFDMAVRGDRPQKGCIQAEIYRAPEVILDAGYSYSANIWSLGVLLWDLLEGRPLFHAIDPHVVDVYDDAQHLAYITALIGIPPPKALLNGGSRTNMFYDQNGILTATAPVPIEFSFESSIRNLKGKDKELFLNFVKRMIKWEPADRSTAKELLQDPWLYAD